MRKRELGGETVTTELKRQISDPVDLSGGYDSIRRRSANYLPPTHLSSTNNGYGLLTTNKRSSLTPLVEGDV
jgi:hypothetical protein